MESCNSFVSNRIDAIHTAIESKRYLILPITGAGKLALGHNIYMNVFGPHTGDGRGMEHRFPSTFFLSEGLIKLFSVDLVPSRRQARP